MRRAISVVLLIIGAWLLVAGLAVSWMDVGEGDFSGKVGAVAIMAAVAAPFLAVGIAVSPGNRTADFGMTLMVAAAVAGGLGLMMWMVFSDPSFRQLMPPGRQMPNVHIDPNWGIAGELIVGGAGYLLWYIGRRRERRGKPDFERIFGDG